MADAKDTKLTIRAILVASPVRITASELGKQFKSLEGREIPYRELGFRTLDLYLKSLKDTLEIYGSGGHAEIRVLLSEKSAHVSALISKQKRPVRKRTRLHHDFYRPPPMRRAMYDTYEINKYESTKPRHKYEAEDCNSSSSEFGSSEHSPNDNSDYDHYKNQNRKTDNLNTSTNKSTNSTYPTPNRNHHYTPQYQNNIQTGSNYNNRTHQNNFNQRRTLLPNPYQYNNFVQQCRRQFSALNNQFLTTSPVQTKQYPILPPTQSKQYPTSPPTQSKQYPTSPPTQSKQYPTSPPTQSQAPPLQSSSSSPNDSQQTSPTLQSNTTRVRDYSPSKHRQILNGNSSSLSSSSKMSEEIDSTSEIYYSEKSTTRDCYKVPHEIQSNLKVLLHEQLKGISCAKIPLLYKERFKKDLHYIKFGYKSLIQMFVELNNICHYKQANKGDFIIFSKEYSVPTDFESRYEREVVEEVNNVVNCPAPCLPNLVHRNLVLTYPPNVVTLDDRIPNEVCHAQENDYIDIQVGEIYDPSKFWFQLKVNGDQLDQLMDDMQKFYEREEENYRVPQTMLLDGLYCAVYIYGEYHRAVICNQCPEKKDRVKIFSIDYGTVSAMSYNQIWFLHRDYMDLPGQAMRGRLTRILPIQKDAQWSRDSAKRFLDLVLNKSLVAQVDSIDEENKIFELFATDTSTSQDIYINDKLVEEGYGIFAHQEQEAATNDTAFVPIYENIHLYPTFDDIENAFVPSSFELNQLEQLIPQFHFHLVFPQYYKSLNQIEKVDEATYYNAYDEINTDDTYKLKSGSEDNYEYQDDCDKIADQSSAVSDQENDNNCDESLYETYEEEINKSCDETHEENESDEVNINQNCDSESPINQEIVNTVVPRVYTVPPPPPGFQNIVPNNYMWSQSVNQNMVDNITYYNEYQQALEYQRMIYHQQQQNILQQYLLGQMNQMNYPPQYQNNLNHWHQTAPIMVQQPPVIIPPPPIIVPAHMMPPTATLHSLSSQSSPDLHELPCSNAASPQFNEMASPQLNQSISSQFNDAGSTIFCQYSEVSSQQLNDSQSDDVSVKSLVEKIDVSVKNLVERINEMHIGTRIAETIERRFIIWIENFDLHCILYKENPYVIVNEVQKKYLQEELPIIKIRRIASGHFIMLNNINLKTNGLLAKELYRLKLIEPTAKTLDVVLLESLPDLLRILTNKDWDLANFEEILKQMGSDSEEWIAT